jgi:homoserine O-acetyltransferase
VDPNNLIARAVKWRSGDIGAHAGGDVAAALGAITAQFVVSPFSEDLFFLSEDCQAEAAAIPKGEFRPIETPMGHVGVFCLRPEDQEAIDAVIAEVLAG